MGDIGKKKLRTGLLLVPPVLFLIVAGPPIVLPLMVLLATFFGLREYYRLALPGSAGIEPSIGIALGLFLSVILACGKLSWIPPAIVLLVLCFCVLFMATARDLPHTVSTLAVTLFGTLYISFLLSHVSLIRGLANGKAWSLFLIATVWAGDISAFSGGSLFGKHKLYPKISPKKTVEGLIAGILGSVIVALIFREFFFSGPKVGQCIVAAVGLAVFGQLGDFTESMLKRSAQVKDSGTMIPGHGGMLDRLDSFLFSAPFLYYFLLYCLKESP